MKTAFLLHNPNAGEGCDSDDLQQVIEEAGFDCRQCELDEAVWKEQAHTAGFTVVAGGDGTVRKVAKELLKQAEVYQPLLALLPMGTANNISKSLRKAMAPQDTYQDTGLADIAAGWHKDSQVNFDTGWVHGLSVPRFFIESTGFGIFPALVQSMQKVDDSLSDQPEDRIETALQMLLELTGSYLPQQYTVEIDGKVVKGMFLSVEVMNIRALGPNLELAPEADPGDGLFDVVLIGEADRERLAAYVQNKLDRKHEPFPFTAIRGASISLQTPEDAFHIDDELTEIGVSTLLQINVEGGRFTFLV